MIIERNAEGAWIISEIIGGLLICRKFYGYTKREAIRLFNTEMRGN